MRDSVIISVALVWLSMFEICVSIVILDVRRIFDILIVSVHKYNLGE